MSPAAADVLATGTWHVPAPPRREWRLLHPVHPGQTENGTGSRTLPTPKTRSTRRPDTSSRPGHQATGTRRSSPTATLSGTSNGPFDCSSAVSHLLQVAGFKNETMTTSLRGAQAGDSHLGQAQPRRMGDDPQQPLRTRSSCNSSIRAWRHPLRNASWAAPDSLKAAAPAPAGFPKHLRRRLSVSVRGTAPTRR
jgi:hypothetical protein